MFLIKKNPVLCQVNAPSMSYMIKVKRLRSLESYQKKRSDFCVPKKTTRTCISEAYRSSVLPGHCIISKSSVGMSRIHLQERQLVQFSSMQYAQLLDLHKTSLVRNNTIQGHFDSDQGFVSERADFSYNLISVSRYDFVSYDTEDRTRYKLVS